MIETHLTGAAALVLAFTALLHAAKAALPIFAKAMKDRAEAARLASEAARLDAESARLDAAARAAAEADLRGRLDGCEERDRAAKARAIELEAIHAEEVGTLRGRLEALRDELEELRNDVNAGHSRPRVER